MLSGRGRLDLGVEEVAEPRRLQHYIYALITIAGICASGNKLTCAGASRLNTEAAKRLPERKDVVGKLVCVEHPFVDRVQQRGLLLNVQPDGQFAVPALGERVEHGRERRRRGIQLVAACSASSDCELVDVFLEN